MRPHHLLPIPLLVAAACGDNSTATATSTHAILDVAPAPIDKLDVMFVIDASGSMADDQAALAATARQAIFEQLEAETGNLPDLHIGVITTDARVGTDGVCLGEGGGGALQVRDGCTAVAGRFLVDAPDGAGGRTRNYDGALEDALACLTLVGTEGCGFEQPFFAVQRAIDPANLTNAGFLRDDAMLLVVFVSDEDDCSALDPALFGDDVETWGALESFRCFQHGVVCDEDTGQPGAKHGCRSREDGEVVLPVAALADELRALKADPTQVMIAGVVGPADPIEVVTAGYGAPGLAPSCSTGEATAAPAVRLRELAAAFPARFALRDACGDLASQIAQISGAAGRVMAASTCLPEPAVAARCRVFDVAAPGTAAEQRTPVPWCDGEATECVEIASDPACAHSGTRLARRGERPAGTHLVVECADGAADVR